MKKILLFVFTLTLIGCSAETEYISHCPSHDISNCPIHDILRNMNMKFVVIDSCEYIQGNNILAHKGNCVYCKVRREKELESLMIKLREK